MKTVVLLVAHGVPPNDFPPQERGEFFGLSGRLQRASGEEKEKLLARQKELDRKMRNWPRTPANDPFHTASLELAENLAAETGAEVVPAFNEFCAPDIDTALDRAASSGAERIVVVSTMMTRGGGHSEEEIGEAAEKGKEKYPGIEIIYAWPYESREVARFLAGHIRKFAP